MFKVTDNNFAFISKWEGLTLVPIHEFNDRPGVVTIGYGCIKYPPFYSNGNSVTIHDLPINRIQARQFFEYELNKKCDSLKVLFPIPLSQYRQDALLSFTYELGVEAIQDSTLRKVILKDVNDIAIPMEWGRWIYSDGKQVHGMALRRAAELKLWFLN
jgi:lysozyme